MPSATFSQAEYEEAKSRVRRLDITSGERGAASSAGRARPEPAGGGNAAAKAAEQLDVEVFDALHGSISDLRRIILGRLTPHPGLQNLLDADFKELQLHLDRLLIHHHSERDRHKEQLASERAAHAQEAAALRTAHEAHLQELHIATLQQREEAADNAEQALSEAEAAREGAQEAARQRQEELEEEFLTRESELREECRTRAEADARALELRLRRELDEEKRGAMQDLAEELIPRIEGELVEAHS
ncbi:hypothetical protein T484DRAFT_1848956 [Baffinella frigidus]|nr:hypothetical protein T484DRAFT_1848956 [Cryptophyta sp. CCMP2293]